MDPSNNTSAGILLPEVNSGRLVALGPGARDLHGNFIPMVEISETDAPNEANVESVTVLPGPDHRIDEQVEISDSNGESVTVPPGPDQVEISETDTPSEANSESVTVPRGPDHGIDVQVEIPDTDTLNTQNEGNGERAAVPAGPDYRIDVQGEIPDTDTQNEGNGESVTVPAVPELRIDVQGGIHEIDTRNEGNGESVTVPADPDRIDVQENQENSVVEEELATKVKLGRKIGIFVAGTAGAGIVGVFNNSVNYPEKSLIDQLFFGASLLFTLISFLFGVVLIGGCLCCRNNLNSIGRIKFVIHFALASIIMVVMFGSAFIIRRAY